MATSIEEEAKLLVPLSITQKYIFPDLAFGLSTLAFWYGDQLDRKRLDSSFELAPYIQASATFGGSWFSRCRQASLEGLQVCETLTPAPSQALYLLQLLGDLIPTAITACA
mgnify:CR=1 FL=1